MRLVTTWVEGTWRYAVFRRSLPDMPNALGEAWADWFDRHGIDYHDVPLRSDPLCCDDTERRIYFDSVCRDASGKLVLGANEVVTSRTFVQLEASALPFPSEEYGVSR